MQKILARKFHKVPSGGWATPMNCGRCPPPKDDKFSDCTPRRGPSTLPLNSQNTGTSAGSSRLESYIKFPCLGKGGDRDMLRGRAAAIDPIQEKAGNEKRRRRGDVCGECAGDQPGIMVPIPRRSGCLATGCVTL